jgi:hypothetical protein
VFEDVLYSVGRVTLNEVEVLLCSKGPRYRDSIIVYVVALALSVTTIEFVNSL